MICPMTHPTLAATITLAALISTGCRPTSPSPVASPANSWRVACSPQLTDTRHVDDLPVEVAQFETVFWDEADTRSLRELLRQTGCRGESVLEIGVGTGLLSLCCLQAGAGAVIGTDINPNALCNAAYNAERILGLPMSQPSTRWSARSPGADVAPRLQLRWVSRDDPEAFAVIEPSEKFDLIVSNPPWEDGKPQQWADYAFYDEDFRFVCEPGAFDLEVGGCAGSPRRTETIDLGGDVHQYRQRDVVATAVSVS